MGLLSKGQKQNHKRRCATTFPPSQCPSQTKNITGSRLGNTNWTSHTCWAWWDAPISDEGAGCWHCMATPHCWQSVATGRGVQGPGEKKKSLQEGQEREPEALGKLWANYSRKLFLDHGQEGKWQLSVWIYKEVVCKFLRIPTGEPPVRWAWGEQWILSILA